MTAPTTHPLPPALEMAVPFAIAELRALPADDREDARVRAIEAGRALLSTRGDTLLYRTTQGAAGQAFAVLAAAVAALAFQPGGVRLFGQHWEAQL